MTKALISLGVAVSGLGLFFQTAQPLLWQSGLSLLALIALAKIVAVLHRHKILGIVMTVAGGIIIMLALHSSEYPDIKEADIRNLWLFGSGGAIACLAGLFIAHLESSQRRQIERLRANWSRIEHPHGYR